MSRLVSRSLLSLAFAASLSLADSTPTVTASDPWVRLPPPGAKNTGAFMVLQNPGKTERKVVSASNAASKVTELHTHLNEGGVMKMRQVPFIAVSAGGKAELKPGSLHVMMIDLVTTLKAGDVVPITLTFDDGTQLVVKAPVRPMIDMP